MTRGLLDSVPAPGTPAPPVLLTAGLAMAALAAMAPRVALRQFAVTGFLQSVNEHRGVRLLN
jgi:hypothetical protein